MKITQPLFRSPSTTIFIILFVGGSLINGSYGQDFPTSLADIAKQCPTEVLKVTPCIDTDVSFENCTSCFGGSILQSDTSGIPTDCTSLTDLACQGLTDCAEKCGLTTLGSTTGTLGAKCGDLFIELIACVAQTQGIGTNCTIDSCPSGSGDAPTAAPAGSGATIGVGAGGSLHVLMAGTVVAVTGMVWTML